MNTYLFYEQMFNFDEKIVNKYTKKNISINTNDSL